MASTADAQLEPVRVCTASAPKPLHSSSELCLCSAHLSAILQFISQFLSCSSICCVSWRMNILWWLPVFSTWDSETLLWRKTSLSSWLEGPCAVGACGQPQLINEEGEERKCFWEGAVQWPKGPLSSSLPFTPPPPFFFFPFLRVLSVQQVQNDSLMHYEEKKKCWKFLISPCPRWTWPEFIFLCTSPAPTI